MLRFFFHSLNKKADELNFWDHVQEFRRYLFNSVIFIFIFTILSFLCKDFIFNTVILSPGKSSFITYRFLCQISLILKIPELCVKNIPLQIINTELGGQFRSHLTISVFSGIVLSFPFIIYQLWCFVKPALKEKEKSKAKGMIFYISLLFFTGVLFGYFIITPFTINFLLNYELSNSIKNYISLNSYISNVTILPLSIGVFFEMPLLIMFLTRINLVSVSFLRKYRIYSYIIILIVSAFITPSTDMFSQIIVSIPIFFLYELSIKISKK